MKYIYFLYYSITLLVFNLGCSQNSRKLTNTSFYVRDDIDTICKLDIFLPKEIDTCYTWIGESDTDCNFYKIRCHSKKYRPVMESGFISHDHIDSGYYFTITNLSRKYSFENQNFSDRIKNIQERLKMDFPNEFIPLKFDSNFYSSNHKFYILRYKVEFDLIKAYTIHHERMIQFDFVNNVLPPDSFEAKAYAILRSVEFN